MQYPGTTHCLALRGHGDVAVAMSRPDNQASVATLSFFAWRIARRKVRAPFPRELAFALPVFALFALASIGRGRPLMRALANLSVVYLALLHVDLLDPLRSGLSMGAP